MARRYLDGVVLLDDATILAGMRFVARAVQAAGRAGRRGGDRGGPVGADPDPGRRARRGAAVGRERRHRTARRAAGRRREASRSDRLSDGRPVDPFAPLEPVPAADAVAADAADRRAPAPHRPTDRAAPPSTPPPVAVAGAGRAADAARRIDPAAARRQLRPAARSSPEMRPASFYVGVVILGTVAPLALAAWATIVTRRPAHRIREHGRARPDVRGVEHVPGLDRRGRVPGRAHRRADHRRLAARGAARRPADHRPPGAGPGSRRVLAGRRGDGDRRRRLVPHPGRDRRRPRLAGRRRREHRDRRDADRDRAVRRAVRLPAGGDRARRRVGGRGHPALAPGLPRAEDGRGRGGALRDRGPAPDPVRPERGAGHRVPDRRRGRAGTGLRGAGRRHHHDRGSSSASSRSGP